jgi:hypothetical protein
VDTTPRSAKITLTIPVGIAACFWLDNMSAGELWTLFMPGDSLFSATREDEEDGYSECLAYL